MGHQLFAKANGATTYKMKFGHRGFNHAVREIATGRVDFTSQNHGYAVAREDLPECLMITHEEINDKSVEGVRHKYYPGFSVQFHPDAAPGPHDASYLFDEFMELMDSFKRAVRLNYYRAKPYCVGQSKSDFMLTHVSSYAKSNGTFANSDTSLEFQLLSN